MERLNESFGLPAPLHCTEQTCHEGKSDGDLSETFSHTEERVRTDVLRNPQCPADSAGVLEVTDRVRR